MKFFLRLFLGNAMAFLVWPLFAQQTAAVDSMRRELAKATTTSEKIYWLDYLSRVLMNVNLQSADSAGRALIEMAEESRDRRLMYQAQLSNGIRCTYFGNNLERINMAIDYFQKAIDLARKNKFEEEIGGALNWLGTTYLMIPDKEKALNTANQAYSTIATLKNDSLLSESQNLFGDIYLARNEKILSLRYYLNGLRIAERLRNDKLIRTCYQNLSSFYAIIEDYDKAIDYAMKAYNLLDRIEGANIPYMRVIDVNGLGKLYEKKKNYELAIRYFERSIAMADSLRFYPLKIPAYISLFNQYLRRDQPDKALAFFNSPEGKGVQAQFEKFNMGFFMDQAYGITYTALGRYDSARYYLDKALPFFEKSTNLENKMYFYHNLGTLAKKTGQTDKAIGFYLELKSMGEQSGSLEHIEFAARELDSLYAKKGDYKASREYNGIYVKYKDSIASLGREKELAQEEAADEHQRQVRLEQERAEQARRRNNIQYLIITFGIFGLFLALVVLGMFKVSASLIRALGFFAFLLFFEFIFLIFKKNIYSITHGEPWKDLAFMIALAALLVPLHHYLEHKVLHYLTSHNRLTRAGSDLRQRIFRKPGSQGS